MKKRILLILGIILILIAVLSSLQFLDSFSSLTEYQKGILTGNSLLFLVGITMAYWGMKK